MSYENDNNHVLREWASATPCVRKVWIFGSRAKGTFQDGSDLDVAVQIDPVNPDETPYASWFHEKAEWHAQLQLRLRVKLDLEWFDPNGSTPTIAKALSEGGVVIYERAS
jgi:predicted nucleotidyltransferase